MKTKRTLGILVIILTCMALSSLAYYQQSEKKSSDNWDVICKSVDSLLLSEIGTNDPGGSIGIIYGNNLVFKKAYGLSDIPASIKNNSSTKFEIGSVSKHFTAYAILLLEQQHKLKLDDPIGLYLPDLPDYKNKVSIRHLIQHTSGIASTDVLRLLANSDFEIPWFQKDEINMIESYPQLNTEPNTLYNYSNSGYTLLAEIIEEASKMNYHDFMNAYIFQPLAMTSSYVFHSPSQAKNITTKGYKKEKDEFIPYQVNSEYTYGSTNIYSNITDMLNWGKHMLEDELSCENYLSRVSTPYNTLENGDTISTTYGLNVSNYKGVKRVKHSGGTLGFRSQFAIYPDQDLCIVILLNTESINSARLLNKICDIVLIDQLVEKENQPRKEIQLPGRFMEAYTGKFRMPDGASIEIKLDADTLKLVIPGNQTFRLFAESEHQFFLKAFDARCKFTANNDGKVDELIWQQGDKDYVAHRIYKAKMPTKEELQEFAGDYYQATFDVHYPVSFDNNKLTLSPPKTFETYLNIGNTELEYIEKDKFRAGQLGILTFERNQKGEISTMILKDLGRVKNFRLEKKL